MKLKDLYENYELKKSDDKNIKTNKDYVILDFEDCQMAIKNINLVKVSVPSISQRQFDETYSFISKQDKYAYFDGMKKVYSSTTTSKTLTNFLEYFDIILTLEQKYKINIITNEDVNFFNILNSHYTFDGYTDWYIPSVYNNEITELHIEKILDISNPPNQTFFMDFEYFNELQVLNIFFRNKTDESVNQFSSFFGINMLIYRRDK